MIGAGVGIPPRPLGDDFGFTVARPVFPLPAGRAFA